MVEIKYPYFTRDRILKIGMLENLRDFPRNALECCFDELSDGIICGLKPIVQEDEITFSKGILKHKGVLYDISSLSPIKYEETETEEAIKIVFLNEEQTHDYRTRFIEFTAGKLTGEENEIELGRFKLKKGAYLRSEYKDLYDFTTEYNTFNIVNVSYAGYGAPTLSNLILKYFAKMALEYNPVNHVDIFFSMLCLNSERVERDVIISYLKNRLADEHRFDNLANHEIHRRLVRVLEVIRQESQPGRPAPKTRAAQMFD